MPFLEEWLIRAVADRPNLKWIVIDGRGINSIDVTAIEGLEDLVSGYRSKGIEILFTHAKRQVREPLKKADWGQKFGADLFYPTTREALRAIGLLKLKKEQGGEDHGQ